MTEILTWLQNPWPWYISGPLIGLVVPMLLLVGGKDFGVSANLRSIVSIFPSKIPFFKVDIRDRVWNLVFLVGLLIGGFVGGHLLLSPDPLAVSPHTIADLQKIGIGFDGNLAPEALFGWLNLLTLKGALLIIGGGLLVGFGASYAGGCTSGHAIMGLANLQVPSLVAVMGFFLGGLIGTFLVLPLILRIGV